jgi:hypothetical protein
MLLFQRSSSGPLSHHQIIYGLSLTLIYYHNHHTQKQHTDMVTCVIGANKLNDHWSPLIIQSLPPFLYSHHQYLNHTWPLSSTPYPHLTFLALMNVPRHQVHSHHFTPKCTSIHCSTTSHSQLKAEVYWHGMGILCWCWWWFSHFSLLSFPIIVLHCHTTSGPILGLQSASPANIPLWQLYFWSVEACSRHCPKSFRDEGGYQIVNIVNNKGQYILSIAKSRVSISISNMENNYMQKQYFLYNCSPYLKQKC